MVPLTFGEVENVSECVKQLQELRNFAQKMYFVECTLYPGHDRPDRWCNLFNDMKCNRRKLVEIERLISISIVRAIVRISLLKNLIDIFIINMMSSWLVSISI